MSGRAMAVRAASISVLVACGPPCELPLRPLEASLVFPLPEGTPTQEPVLEFGPQGGQHLWIAVDVRGGTSAPRDWELALEAWTVGPEGERRVGGFVRPLPDPKRAGNDGPTRLGPFVVVVASWEADAAKRVTARVSDACGDQGFAEWTSEEEAR